MKTHYFPTTNQQINAAVHLKKIFEKVILEQITTYLDSNDLIHIKYQYGFRKNH